MSDKDLPVLPTPYVSFGPTQQMVWLAAGSYFTPAQMYAFYAQGRADERAAIAAQTAPTTDTGEKQR